MGSPGERAVVQVVVVENSVGFADGLDERIMESPLGFALES